MTEAAAQRIAGPAAPGVARAPLHVLRVGDGDDGGDWDTGDGVEARRWTGLDVELPAAFLDRPLAAIEAGTAVLDLAPLGWADVLIFRGPFATVPACLDCPLADADEAALLDHARRSGHIWRRPVDVMVRGLVTALGRNPSSLRARGIALERIGTWPDVVPDPERDVTAALLAMADAVVEAEAGPTDRRLAALWQAAQAIDAARFARRMTLRAADAEATARLAARATKEAAAADPARTADPLVSVVIPAGDAPEALVDRAVASALAMTGVRLEVVVAGTRAHPSAAGDPRVRRVVVDGTDAAAMLAAALDAATGDWIATLDPASLLAEDHAATLLSVVREYDLDAIYAQTLLVDNGEPRGLLGGWPPSPDAVAFDASLVAADLVRRFAVDPDAEADGEDPRWNLWRRWSDAGARLAGIDGPLAIREVATP